MILSVAVLMSGCPFDPTRDFAEDTTGSGSMGDQAWFQKALEMLAPEIENGNITCIVDIGCGDGTFLSMVKARWPHVKVIGAEYQIQQKPALVNFMEEKDIRLIEGSLSEPESTANIIATMEDVDLKKTMVTSFHILQEVLNLPCGSLSEVVNGHNQHFYGILTCDMYDFPTKIIQKYAPTSHQPEINLANAMTKQALLSREHVIHDLQTSNYNPESIVEMVPFDRDKPATNRVWLYIAHAKAA